MPAMSAVAAYIYIRGEFRLEGDHLEAAIAEPSLYDGPPERIAELTKMRSQVIAILATAEEKWLEAQEALEQANN